MVASIVYVILDRSNLAVLLLFGTAFSIIFQRSRLCFAAGFREIFASRDTRLLRWILVAEILGMIGFSILKFKGFIPSDHFVFPTGVNSIVGGFIFGIGMVIAGGCGSGILWRSAEGYVRHWFAVIGGMLAAGSWVLLYGAKVGEGWLYGPKVFLPDFLGWPGALVVSVLVLMFYAVLVFVEVKKKMSKPVSFKFEDGSYCIDLRNWMCPYPKYMLDPIFEKLPADGSQVILLVDCPSASTDVPDVARQKGYTVKEVSQIDDGEWKVVINY